VGRQLSEIGLRQFEKLARHFDRDMRAQLEKALFSPAARDALRRYNRWLAEVRDHAAASTERRSRKELFERVQALPGVYGSFVQHVNELGLGGDRPRIAVALLRTLEPLLVSRQTGGIERDWRELNDTELRTFIEFGLRRELILLTRADSEVRAQITNSANSNRASKRRK